MKTIEDVLKASTDELMKILTNILLTYYPKNVWVFEDDFIYAVGKSPICIMAHVDTVRDPQIKPDAKWSRRTKDTLPMALYQERNILRNANGVLGADDRAGIFACLELVRKCKREKLPLPSVIFANGEESGGQGIGVFVSTDAFKRHDNNTTRLFVEMDRCNATEWVTYGGPLPKEVVEYVESFGFHKASGSYSDVADMQDEYLIPGVNLSIGYYRQHSDEERLHIDEMYMTINRVMNMLRDPIDKLYKVDPTLNKWSNYGYDDWYNQSHPRTTTTSNKTSGNSDALLRGTGQQQKKDESGSAEGSHGFPHDKKGSDTVDDAMDTIAKDGWCRSCGFEWEECECGHILMEITKKLEDDMIELLVTNYTTEDSRLHTLLKAYLETQYALRKAAADSDTSTDSAETPDEDSEAPDPRDPFHVGNEGDPIPTEELIIDVEIESSTDKKEGDTAEGGK